MAIKTNAVDSIIFIPLPTKSNCIMDTVHKPHEPETLQDTGEPPNFPITLPNPLPLYIIGATDHLYPGLYSINYSYTDAAVLIPRVELPELSIKNFGEDVTKWATFWDSINSAGHCTKPSQLSTNPII